MPAHKLLFVVFGGLLLGMLFGGGLKLFRSGDAPSPTPIASADREPLSTMPDFSYPDLNNELRHGKEWNDKVLVLNFWATWCPPCRREIPLFMELQEEYRTQGVEFVGIAVDDPEPVREFVDTYEVNYPTLLGDMQAMTLSRKLGNRVEGLPFTVIAAPGGEVVLRHSGEIARSRMEPVLRQVVEGGVL